MTHQWMTVNAAAVAATAMLAAGCTGSSTSSESPPASSATPANSPAGEAAVPADYPTGTWSPVGRDPRQEKLTFYDAATVRLQDSFGFNDESLSFPAPHRVTFGRSLGADSYCTAPGTYSYGINKGSLRFRPVGKDNCRRRASFFGNYAWKLIG